MHDYYDYDLIYLYYVFICLNINEKFNDLNNEFEYNNH